MESGTATGWLQLKVDQQSNTLVISCRKNSYHSFNLFNLGKWVKRRVWLHDSRGPITQATTSISHFPSGGGPRADDSARRAGLHPHATYILQLEHIKVRHGLAC